MEPGESDVAGGFGLKVTTESQEPFPKKDQES